MRALGQRLSYARHALRSTATVQDEKRATAPSLFDAHGQFARPLKGGGDVVVVVAEIGAFAGGFELHGQRVEPLAGGDRILLRDLASVLGALIGGIRHIAVRVQGGAAALGGGRVGLARHGGREAGARFLDAQLVLAHPADPISLGLRFRIAARLLQINDAAR